MKKSIYITALFVFALCGVEAHTEQLKSSFHPAPSLDACKEILIECITLTDTVSKNNCIKETAEHLFCKGSHLGQLAYARWSISSYNSPKKNGDYTTNDLHLLDQSCLENFDNLFSARLLHGNLIRADASAMVNLLNSCKKEEPMDLNRQ